jgi:tetratricopeptide (TPR) repeat protein
MDAQAQWAFAEHAFNSADYRLAINEYQRFLYFFKEDPRNAQAKSRIGFSYYHLEEYLKAISIFNELIESQQDPVLTHQAYLMISECQLKLHAPGQAVTTLHNLIAVSDDPAIRDQAYYRLGWIAIESADWQTARREFGHLSPDFQKRHHLDQLSAQLDAADQAIAPKNPTLAGFLSIVPGLGQLYCARYQDALIAFLLNTGLILAAYESFNQELYALGGVITFVEFGFYAGNIYGAISDAHKFNQVRTQRFIERLKENSSIGLAPVGQNDGMMLCFRYVF